MTTPLRILFLLLFFSGRALAQVDYTIGTGTGTNTGTSYPTPYGDFFEGSRTQLVFRAAELTAAGMSAGIITAIKWNVTNTNGATAHESWELKIGTTTNNDANAWITGLTTVVSSTNYTPTTGVNVHTFSAPFFWNGTSNIVVETCHGEPTNATGTWFTSNASVPFTVMSYNASRTFRADNVGNACGNTGNSALSPTNRPNTIFTLVSTPCTAPPTPGTLTASVPSVCQSSPSPVTFKLTGHSMGISQTYQLQTSTTATGTYTNLGASSNTWVQTVTPTTTLFYRMAVTCGTSTTFSTPVLVQVNSVLTAGVYTINNTAPTAGTNYNNFTDAVYALKCGITGPVTFNVATGVYNEQIEIPSVSGTSATSRVLFQSAIGDANSVLLTFNGALSGTNHVLKLNGASFITFKAITISNTNATFGHAINMAGAAAKDSIVNCKVMGSTTVTTAADMATVYATNVTGADNVFYNNDISYGSQCISMSGNATTLPSGWVFERNTIVDAFNQLAFLQNMNNLKFRDNEMSITSLSGTQHCMFIDNADNALEITGNKMFAVTDGTRFGIFMTGCNGTATNRGLVWNNIIAAGSVGTTALFGIRVENSTFQRYYNNSVNVNSGTGGSAAFFTFNATLNNNEVKNNVFQNIGKGPAITVTEPTGSTTNSVDYNNISSYDTVIAQSTTPAAIYTKLSNWRIASGMDKNSISYDAGFMNATDLTPDVNNPSSWSLNGRGVHIAVNNKDITGGARVTTLANGVPDIGAYEFTPATIPPVAVAVPALPENGITQYFMFGQDTVAAIDWSGVSLIPATVTVRQYTGTIAPQVAPINSGSYMYFYTDIDVLASTYDFNARVYYKDPWLGSITNEGNIKMLKRFGTYPWIAYNGTGSTANTARNFISAPGLTSHGYFTGINDGNVFSSHISPSGKVVFCPGGSVTLRAEPMNSAYTYQWKMNGAPIPGAITSSYIATISAVYEVDVMNGNQLAATMPMEVYVVATPSTVVTPSGPTRFCAGGSVALNVATAAKTKYQWIRNGVDITGATSPVYNVTNAGSYTVKVTNTGCAGISLATNVSIGAPIVNLGRDTAFCQNSALILDAGNPGAQYIWNTGATTQTITVPGVTSGQYSVRVVAGPGCETVDDITLTVDPLPTVVGISYVSAGNSYKLSPSGDVNASSYLWIFGDGKTDTARELTYNYSYRPNSVRLVVFNACGSDTTEAHLALSVNDITGGKNAGVSVYPNPAQSMLNVAIEGEAMINDLVVLNNLGQVVYRAKADGAVKEQRINIGNLPNGHYILRVNTVDNNVFNKQFDVLR